MDYPVFFVRCRVVCRWIAILGFPISVLAQPVTEPERPSVPLDVIERVEGNWEVTSTNTPKEGETAVSHISLRAAQQLMRNGVPFNSGDGFVKVPNGTLWYYQRVDALHWMGQRRDAVALSADGTLTVTGHWGRVSTLRFVGPDTLRGSWKHKDNSGEEIWQRLTPRITAIEFAGKTTDRVVPGDQLGRLHVNYEGGDGMRGNKRSFEVRIFGENLWGRHHVWIEGVDVEAYWLTPIHDDKIGPERKIIGLKLRGYVWSGVSPGRKNLRFNNLTIPFFLALDGYPNDAVALDWLEADRFGGRRLVTEAPVGTDVILRARAFQPGGADRIDTTVRVSRADGSTENVPVRLSRLAPGLMLESDVLHLVASTTARENGIRVLGGDRLEASNKFSAAPLAVTAPSAKIRYVQAQPGGGYIPADEPLVFGTAFFVEVQLDRPRAESVLLVDLTWWQAAQSEPIEVQRVNDDPLLFRSKEIRLLPAARKTP